MTFEVLSFLRIDKMSEEVFSKHRSSDRVSHPSFNSLTFLPSLSTFILWTKSDHFGQSISRLRRMQSDSPLPWVRFAHPNCLNESTRPTLPGRLFCVEDLSPTLDRRVLFVTLRPIEC